MSVLSPSQRLPIGVQMTTSRNNAKKNLHQVNKTNRNEIEEYVVRIVEYTVQFFIYLYNYLVEV